MKAKFGYWFKSLNFLWIKFNTERIFKNMWIFLFLWRRKYFELRDLEHSRTFELISRKIIFEQFWKADIVCFFSIKGNRGYSVFGVFMSNFHIISRL